MPNPVMIGRKIGVKITVEEILSIKHPTTNRNKLITRRIAKGFDIFRILLATDVGTCDIVRNLAKDMEIPTKNVVCPLVSTVSFTALKNDFHVISL